MKGNADGLVQSEVMDELALERAVVPNSCRIIYMTYINEPFYLHGYHC